MRNRETFLSLLYNSRDPFENFPTSLFQIDQQGWNSEHPYLAEAIESMKPKLVVEVGVWKGASTIFMGEKISSLGLDCAIIAVDTWLGSWDHWIHEVFRKELNFIHGYPTLYNKFAANILAKSLEKIVIPLPLDSINAYNVLKEKNIVPDIIHIDGGHDYQTVRADIEAWWGLLAEGGMLIGDDYFEDIWPGVRRAYDEFAKDERMVLEHMGGKCRFQKRHRSKGDVLPVHYAQSAINVTIEP